MSTPQGPRTKRRDLAQERKSQAVYRNTPNGRARALLSNARWRARKNKVAFSLTAEWLTLKLERGVCEVTGIPLQSRGPFAPTLDRIDAGGDYSESNTQLTCWIYNRAKGPDTHTEVLLLAKALT